ncbi:BNR-4 repeat-containing protein [Patulibacter defluvii]|uniref:BNR-4 repeat-containing protein n=1 Tax=Patulibacter defluvii TaxID=3095358 RepID=UPI002A75A130|nr:BNR-4 repeat-containing protein [Patulibacter sp. DM4]
MPAARAARRLHRTAAALGLAAAGALAASGPLGAPAPASAAGRKASVPKDCRRTIPITPEERKGRSRQAAVPAPGPTPLAPTLQTTTTRLGEGAWSYFGDPRAVAIGPNLYSGWISRSGAVRVAKLNPTTGDRRVVTVGRTGRDDHNNPALVVRPGGKLLVFFSPHSGRERPFHVISRMYYRETVVGHDIRRWSPVRTVPVNARGELGYTYPNPVSIGGGRTFVAWRGGCWRPTFAIRKGRHWSPAREIVRGPRGQRPYAKYAPGPPGSGIVHLCYTQAHPAQAMTNVYCLSFHEGTFRRADGQVVGDVHRLPLPAATGDLVYRFDQALGRAWVMDVADDGAGHPVVVFSVGYNRNWQRFLTARWIGDRWRVSRITPAYSDNRQRFRAGAFETGGIALDPRDPDVVYPARIVDGRGVVERWTSPDHGKTWARERRISPGGRNCFRPTTAALDGDRTAVLYLCGTLKYWTDFRTAVHVTTLTPTAAPVVPPPPAG